MSLEKPTDDPRQHTDKGALKQKGSLKQTDEPWKGPVEKEQGTGVRKSDLDRWQETDTH